MWRIMYWILVHLFLSLNIYDLGFSYYIKYLATSTNCLSNDIVSSCWFMNIIRIIYNSTETGRVINQVKIPSRMSRITGHCTGYLLFLSLNIHNLGWNENILHFTTSLPCSVYIGTSCFGNLSELFYIPKENKPFLRLSNASFSGQFNWCNYLFLVEI